MRKKVKVLDTYQIEFDNLQIEVERKNIKNIYISIYQKTGRIRISSPRHLNEQQIKSFVTSKIDWIKKQKEKINLVVNTDNTKISSEFCYYQGRKYSVKFIKNSNSNKVVLKDSNIEFHINQNLSEEQKILIIYEWQRYQLKKQVPSLISKWENIIGIKIYDWGIRKMKSKWGTCHRLKGKIWLSLELAKVPSECLEYVILHELVHFIEKSHNAKFKSLMTYYMPNWKNIKNLMKEF